MGNKRQIIVWAIVAVLGLALFVSWTLGRQEVSLTIVTGPQGSVSSDAAMRLQTDLAAQGYNLEIIRAGNANEIVEAMSGPQADADLAIAFGNADLGVDAEGRDMVASSVSGGLQSLGTIGILPLLFAVEGGRSEVSTVSDLRGLTISIPRGGYAGFDLAMGTLDYFGVTAANSRFLYADSTEDAVRQVLDGDAEALVAPGGTHDGTLIPALRQQALHILDVPESVAIAGTLTYSDVTSIPQGAYFGDPVVPSSPLQTPGLLVTVVARSDLGTSAIYAIAGALEQEYGRGSIYSATGEFPNFANRSVPPNRVASAYYATGEIPWQFTELPPRIADAFIPLLLVGSLILVFASIYSLFLPEVYTLWNGILQPRSQERFIAHMERTIASGRELSVKQRDRLSRILAINDAGRALRQRSEALREQLDDTADMGAEMNQPPAQ